MELERLLKLGKELGKSGSDLEEWVEVERKHERDERARVREMERQKKEFERQERAQERDAELAHKAEMMKVESLVLERKKELMRLELEVQETAENHSLAVANTESQVQKWAKLPPFEDDKDDLDAYLKRFERWATSRAWEEVTWASRLSVLLKGKALEVYSRLSDVDANIYAKLKQALLHRYQLTEEGFREKFRFCKPVVGETATQFVIRLEGYLFKWLRLAGKTKNFEDLKDLMMREQFLAGCNKDITLFLKERNPESIYVMANLADQYIEARGATSDTMRYCFPGPRKQSGRPEVGRPDVGKMNNSQNRGKREFQGASSKPECYLCHKQGHISRYCPSRAQSYPSSQRKPYSNFQKVGAAISSKLNSEKSSNNQEHKVTRKTVCPHVSESEQSLTLNCGCELGVVSASCGQEAQPIVGMPVVTGKLGNTAVRVLRDTGCSGVVVKKALIPSSAFSGEKRHCVLADGTLRTVDVANVYLSTPYFTGQVDVLCMENPLYDVILGNIEGAHGPTCHLTHSESGKQGELSMQAAVQTRSQVKEKNLKSLKSPIVVNLEISKEELIAAQQADKSLEKFQTLAKTGEKRHSQSGQWYFMNQKGLLYRIFISPKVNYGDPVKQLVVPKELVSKVLRIAHESIFGGHLATRKTAFRVLEHFYWPDIWGSVRRYCQSCDICQRTTPRGRTTKVPLGQMPIIEQPFHRVAVDIVGPIYPSTDRKNRFILTLVDYATRYPEAIPLPSVETERVADALIQIFSRVGLPVEILSDKGSQFTSQMMAEVSRLLSIRQLTTTPYHPACNGLVERFNGTLKQMLKKMCAERPRDWDRYLDAVLFAYRDSPQESLGFSPFELLYGRSVRGPLSVLRELWDGEQENPVVKSTYQYVLDLQEKLEQTCLLARENLSKASKRYKKIYDRKTRRREFKVGQKVLLLLPTDNNKLLMHWKGPYNVVEKVGHMDYRIDMNGKVKTFHANLLKLYHDQPPVVQVGLLVQIQAAVVEEDFKDQDGMVPQIELPAINASESVADIAVGNGLSSKQELEVNDLLEQFPDVFTDLPGKTSLVEHDIKLTASEPIRQKPYPIPLAHKDAIDREVAEMLKIGVIEKSDSPYSSPIVLVQKKDGGVRFCVDFRKVNNITVFDAEPIPQPEEIFAMIGPSKFFTKLDLTKGYWQVPVSEDVRRITAFATSKGLFQFKTMPFGLVNAPATFSRMMRKLLDELEGVSNFIDDILVYSETWEDHMVTLSEVLTRLRKAGLTAKPSKCYVAFQKIEYLGHVVGEGKVSMQEHKVETIKGTPFPKTKTQLRSFLGLSGYYRKFIPNYSAISAPLTDLTRKGSPNKIVPEPGHTRAFETLKSQLSQNPILRLPDVNKTFILRADASNAGVGGVLLQESDGELFPITYISRKLLDREKSYAVIEKECLALVWAIQKLQMYLYGTEFILQTDHAPLLYLNKARNSNGRIMRWALALQPYRFRIEAIKGKTNVGADFLSRKEN